ncbi:MAG: DUF4231 domain-containing protein [Acidobacteriota bacterium]
MSDETNHEQAALRNAWLQFATFDHNAIVIQARFYRLRGAVLWMGVIATALAVIYSHFVAPEGDQPEFPDWRHIFWLVMVMAPISVTVLSTGAAKLARGVDWVALRGAAEATKREIFRFRCGVDGYDHSASQFGERAEMLSKRVGQATSRLMDTDVLQSSLEPYGGELPPKQAVAQGDDGMSDLEPEHYLTWRLEDQRAFFQSKAKALDRRNHLMQWAIAGLGGLGTLFASVGQEIWVPVAVSVSTALTSYYLQLRSVETHLAGYNRASLELSNVATWWCGLSQAAKQDHVKFSQLVERTEAILTSENSSWVQNMQAAVAQTDDRDE